MLYPSTLYPGGPSAAAALSHHLQPQQLQPSAAAAARQRSAGGGSAGGGAAAAAAHMAVPIPSGLLQQQQQQQWAASAYGGVNNASNNPQQLAAQSMLLQANSLAGSDFLPANEREELSSRVAASQSLLQSYYESQVCVLCVLCVCVVGVFCLGRGLVAGMFALVSEHACALCAVGMLSKSFHVFRSLCDVLANTDALC